MREYILSEGRQLYADEPERGQLLVHPRDEWVRRYTVYVQGRLGLDIILLATCISLALLFLEPMVLFLFGVGSVVLGGSVFVGYSSLRDISRGGAVPGVYSNGVELPMYPLYGTRLFIPSGEVADAWVLRNRLLGDMVYLQAGGTRWRWRFPVSILGEEGVHAVMTKVKEPFVVPDLPHEEPPALVLYTSEGMQAQRRSGDM